MKDLIVILLLLTGVGFVLLAAIGALRFQDALTRMAAVSKASTLGLTLILSAVIVSSLNYDDAFKAIATIAILWISAPIGAHLLGRAALLTNEKLIEKTQGTVLIAEIKKNNLDKDTN